MANGADEEWEKGEDTRRIESFSDGVFAIAITLLVLEINLPHRSAASGEHLAATLLHLWPAYFAYVFSFVLVGIYWANHHYIFRLYKRTDHNFILLNIFFLMCISFVPLPTAVLGEYTMDPAGRRSAIIFYNFGMFLPAFAWGLCWFYGSRGHKLIDKRLDPAFVGRLTRQYVTSIFSYVLAIAVSFVSPFLGLCVTIAQTVLYLMVPRRPVFMPEHID